jgi:proton-dependent oligopeptide transporter, POT family
VSIGSGLFLPSITPLFGAICNKDSISQETSFTLYYLAKNVGALLSPIISGYIANIYGYHFAFIFNGLAMFSGVVVFYLGKAHLKHIVGFYINKRKSKHKIKNLFSKNIILLLLCLFVPLISIVIKNQFDGILLAVASIFVACYLTYVLFRRDKTTRRNFAIMFFAFAIMFIYLICLGQGGTTLNLFIDRITDRLVFHHLIPTSVYYALDPIFMLTIGPLVLVFVVKISHFLQSKLSFQKLTAALFILGVAYGIFFFAAKSATISGHSSSAYIVLAYILFPITELLLFPTILSLLYDRSPKDLIGVTMGVFMLAQALSAYGMGMLSKYGRITFKINSLAQLKNASGIYQHFFATICFSLIASSIIAFVFLLISKRQSIKLTPGC